MLSSKELIAKIHEQSNMERINQDWIRYEIYNGQIRETIKKAIAKEFILPETVSELINRIIPVNIVQKIVNKLAQVYRESPVRTAANGLESDQEALDFYTESMQINRKFKWSNRLFKLHKHDMLEPYLTSDGRPAVRVLPSHTYTLFSEDPIEPNKPTTIVKHLKIDQANHLDERHVVWSETEHYIMDGMGNKLTAEMAAMNNPDGINPIGIIPFVLIRENDDQLLPMSDDDLISMQIAINLLLTDLAFATKYQAWSIIWLKNVETQKLSFNPNSVITLNGTPGQPEPDIGTIKPELDSDAMLRQVEALVALLLTTKSLSVGSVSGKLDTKNASSGVAKMLDEAETTEDRKDQIAFFEQAEKEFWDKFSQHMLPYWIENQSMDPEFVKPFSKEFELNIAFQDAKLIVSEKEKIEQEKAKLEAGLTSKIRALRQLNPGLSDEEASALLAEIRKEDVESVKFMQRNMNEDEPADQEEPVDGQDQA